ncbi:MAG TPA: NUDIX hydrolase [Capsulimonadaceae bacterium]|nr:NUDIX hydrolase [Capsulimonadaceae bacterium]
MYKKLSSKIVFTHPRMTLVEDQIELPNGHQADYLWTDHRIDGVTVIAKDQTGLILVEKEYSYLPNRSLYQFAGGGINAGEEPEAAANRELGEEVGLYAGRLISIGTYYLDHRRTDALMHVFLGEEITARKSETSDIYEVDMQALWISEAEIEELIAKREIVNSPMLACWSLYKSR